MWSGKMTQETPNSHLVDEAWGDDSEYIYNWFTEDENITDLRFIIRDGQRILQAKYKVHVEFSEPLPRETDTKDSVWYAEAESKRMWLDVPLEIE